MSQEDVEAAKHGLEAWQRGDFDAWLASTDPAVGLSVQDAHADSS